MGVWQSKPAPSERPPETKQLPETPQPVQEKSQVAPVEKADEENDIPLLRYTAKVKKLCGSNPGTTNGPFSVAQFIKPQSIVIDQHGNVYVADYRTIRKINVAQKRVERVMDGFYRPAQYLTKTSSGSIAYFCEKTDRSGTAIYDLEANVVGDMFVVGVCMCIDETNGAIIRASTRQIFGHNGELIAGDFGNEIRCMTVDYDKNIYVVDSMNVIFKIENYDTFPKVSVFAGQKGKKQIRDGKPGMFLRPWGIVYHKEANCLYVTDMDKIRKISMDVFIRTIYGNDATTLVPKHDFRGIAINNRGTIFMFSRMMLSKLYICRGTWSNSFGWLGTRTRKTKSAPWLSSQKTS